MPVNFITNLRVGILIFHLKRILNKLLVSCMPENTKKAWLVVSSPSFLRPKPYKCLISY